ncbi:MAG: hypothetical protein L6W00_07830 [Lentisphaeria bacterium]|nr:MAG: hypothetical protein L6W00_07830 [Lentisphaeria bacterium]
MATGRYTAEDPGREDYAAVYQDKIFLHIKAPELHSGRAAYWDWAGTYELTGAGEIRPDMDRETGKLWNFYYTFLSKREGIVVNDLSENKGISAAVPSGAEASGYPVGDSAGSRRTTAAVKLFPPVKREERVGLFHSLLLFSSKRHFISQRRTTRKRRRRDFPDRSRWRRRRQLDEAAQILKGFI